MAATTCLVIGLLIGPAARYLSGERTPITDTERRQMTATERIEALNAARHTLIQAATGLVVIGGVAFTALGLWYTARTVETAQEGQITDRYTKAVEQLGHARQDVRLGGIYALQRLADDSPRDKDTIRNVLSAYVRSHDSCTVRPEQKKPPRVCASEAKELRIPEASITPGADVIAALSIASDLGSRTAAADLSRVRFPTTILRSTRMPHAYLVSADLRGADLVDADLRGVNLRGANLRSAGLASADLRGTDLRAAYLRDADLGGADLRGANLRGANLSGAALGSADPRGADLRAVLGKTEQEIREAAVVDSNTLIDPLL